MLEPVRQPLGALGGLLRDAGRHGARDGEELGFDTGPDASRPLAEQPVQSPDGPLQAHDRVTLVLLSPGLKVDERSHARIVDPASDISVEEAQVVSPVVTHTMPSASSTATAVSGVPTEVAETSLVTGSSR